MGRSCSDYNGYGSSWLSKTDLTPKNLKKYGIKASVKEIKLKSANAIDGYVFTGMNCGYFKRVSTYSISKLKEFFQK